MNILGEYKKKKPPKHIVLEVLLTIVLLKVIRKGIEPLTLRLEI